MITAIDTNILIDILEPDIKFAQLSKQALEQCFTEGEVVACEIVWAEVLTTYQEKATITLQLLKAMGIAYSPLSQRSALGAARSWYQYRQQGGTRSRIAADFLIGAHAFIQCDRLLSRDNGFFRSYFNALTVVNPTEI